MDFKIGDIVGRKSYSCDVIFEVVNISSNGLEKQAVLRGITHRLMADAPFDDLVLESGRSFSEKKQYKIKR